jgi:nitroreductase
MNTAVLESLKTRRSCRSYRPEQIKKEELDAVLEAGTWAPTGMGTQEPLIVVVQDPEKIAAIERLNGGVMGNPDGHPFYGAPTVLVVFADSSRMTYLEDGSLVMGNLLNAAHAVGLGSCWIHRAKESFETPEGKAMKEAWGIPDSYVGIGNCILGYAVENAPTRPRKENYVIFD